MADHASTVAADEEGTALLTLVAGDTYTITFAKDQNVLEVVNTSTTDAVSFSRDGSTPTAGGAKTLYVPPNMALTFEPKLNDTTGRTPKVILISSGTPTVRVQAGA